jgi:hypothetical protein
MSDTLRDRIEVLEEAQAVLLPGMAEANREIETMKLTIHAQDDRNAQLAAATEELLTSMQDFAAQTAEGTAEGLMTGLAPILERLLEHELQLAGGQLQLAKAVADIREVLIPALDRIAAIERLLAPALRGQVRLMAQQV